jgi:hypothetical protein
MDDPKVRAPERIMAMRSVSDDLADDAPALAAVESRLAGEDWVDFVHRHGGDPVGVPELRREPNPHYGWPVIDAGGPVLDEDGEPVRDRVKFTLIATGEALRR